MLNWNDADRAWQAVEWCLARDSRIGVPLNEAGMLRAFVYDGAVSIGQPDIEVIYEILANAIIVQSVVFSKAKATHAGRG
jgi:hypothetical protein